MQASDGSPGNGSANRDGQHGPWVCRSCGSEYRKAKRPLRRGKPENRIGGAAVMCRTCVAAARVAKSTEKMLVRRIKRQTQFVEPFPVITFDSKERATTEDEAFEAICRMRWPRTSGEPTCPKCGGTSPYNLRGYRKFRCSNPLCTYQFSPTSGTAYSSRKMSYLDLFRVLAGHVVGKQHKTHLDHKRRRLMNKRQEPATGMGRKATIARRDSQQ